MSGQRRTCRCMTTRAQTRPAPGDTMTIPVAVPRRWPPRLVGPVAAVWMLLPLLSLHAADPPTKEFVLKQYRQSLEALRTFECELRIETTYLGTRAEPQPPPPPSTDSLHWTQDGERFAAFAESSHSQNGSIGYEWTAFDGETQSHCSWSNESVARGRTIPGYLTRDDRSHFAFPTPRSLLGTNLLLEGLLQQPETKALERKQGAEFLSVWVPDPRKDEDSKLRSVETLFEFAPEHGYLPRRVRRIFHRSRGEPLENDFQVIRFENLSNEPERPVWFPKAAILADRSKMVFVNVERAKLAPDVPGSTFTPRFPLQTVIDDTRFPADRLATVEIPDRGRRKAGSPKKDPEEYPPPLQKVAQKGIALIALSLGVFLLIRPVLRRVSTGRTRSP